MATCSSLVSRFGDCFPAFELRAAYASSSVLVLQPLSYVRHICLEFGVGSPTLLRAAYMPRVLVLSYVRQCLPFDLRAAMYAFSNL